MLNCDVFCSRQLSVHLHAEGEKCLSALAGPLECKQEESKCVISADGFFLFGFCLVFLHRNTENLK